MTENSKVKIGTTFRSHYADGMPLWRVIRSRGHGAWDCEVDASEPDWAGTKKIFATEEILRSLAQAEIWSELANEHDRFWASRKPGETVHYHNSFGEYVRGIVVAGFDRDGRPAHVMRPTALVGSWKQWDLPRWYDSGEYRDGGYYVSKIRTGETFQPNSSSIWEAPGFSRPMGPSASIDPTKLDAIDLTPPDPTPGQAEASRLLLVINSIRNALKAPEGGVPEDFASEYRRQLRAAARILSEASLDDENAPTVTF